MAKNKDKDLKKAVDNVSSWYKNYLQSPNYERMVSKYNYSPDFREHSDATIGPQSETSTPKRWFPDKEAGLSFSTDQVYFNPKQYSHYKQYPTGFNEPNWDFKKGFFGYGQYGDKDRFINVNPFQSDVSGNIWNPIEVLAHEY